MHLRRSIALLCALAVHAWAQPGDRPSLKTVQVVDEGGRALAITPEPAWTDVLQSCLGQPVDDALRTRLADGLLAWFARHDQPMMSIEELDSAAGEMKFRAVAGRIHHVFLKGGSGATQRVAATRWATLEGEPLRVSLLEEELAWFHRNPLHIALLNLAEAPSPDGPPLADVIVNLEQSHAVRASLAYRNDGIAPLSEHRFTGSLEAADLFGLPSWWNLQSTVAEEPSSYQQYRASARFFLPWQHELALSGGLVRVSAPTDEFAGLINAIDAQSWTGSARYVVPFKLPSAWTLDVGLGADFRRTNNTLELGSLTLAGDADSTSFATDFTLRKQTLLRDTGLSLSLNYSPGGITSNDDDAHHSALRAEAEAQHFITRASVWHRRESTSGWTLLTQASGQWSDVPVLPQDQLMLASSASVRGFEEASVLADRGLWGTIEVRAPALNLKQRAVQVQPLTFIDGGIGWDRVRDDQQEIASVGLGGRVSFWRSVSASCSYAWRLTEPGGRMQLAVTATF